MAAVVAGPLMMEKTPVRVVLQEGLEHPPVLDLVVDQELITLMAPLLVVLLAVILVV